MQAIVRDAMAHGAVGFASSTSPAHNGEGGLPMPSRLASDAEMAALVAAMGEGGRGVYMLTKGGHTPMPFLESLAAQRRPAGDGRGAAAQQRRAARGVRRPRRDRRRQRARPSPARPGLVLPADDGLHARVAVSGRRPCRAGSRRSGGPALRCGRCSPTGVSRRRARRAGDADDVSPLQQRVGQGPCGRDRACRELRASSSARSPRSPPTTGSDPLDTMLDLALAET